MRRISVWMQNDLETGGSFWASGLQAACDERAAVGSQSAGDEREAVGSQAFGDERAAVGS